MAAGTAYRSNHAASGEEVGTGAIMSILVGFKPTGIKILNRTQASKAEWDFPMADGSGFKTVTAGTFTYVGVDLITPTYNGFTLGVDADLNAIGDIIYWEAIK